VIISSMGDARLSPNLWDGVSGISVCRMQLEDVTGQSIQTPSEYVSTNVLTTATFHGSNVDGVKCFKTTIAWLPISPSTLKGFLCEWARTNLFLQSEDFSTTWTLAGWTGIITTNQTIAPDGRMTADLFTTGVANLQQGFNQSITTTSAVYAMSIYVKPNGHNYIQFNCAGAISVGYVNFDLSTGTVGTQSLWTGTIETLPNGWYRLKVITNTISTTTWLVSVFAVPSSNSARGVSFAGDGVSGFYMWGAQFELWPNVSSYIPTTTVAVTRNIDVLTYDVRNVIANQWAFSVVSTMDDNEIFDRRALNLSSFTINRLHVQLRTLWIPNVGIVYWDGVTVRSVIGVAAWTNNIAVSWKNWVWLNLYMNNIKYIGNFVPSLAFTIIDVGGGVLWYPIFWCTKNLRVWKTVPTDAELLSLSNQS